jgi:hypothetical protein
VPWHEAPHNKQVFTFLLLANMQARPEAFPLW